MKSAFFTLSVFFLSLNSVYAAPKADLWAFWQKSAESSAAVYDHSPFQKIIDKLVTSGKDGINRVAYAKFSADDKKALSTYIADLEKSDPANYSRKEQKAFWINLYNALTIKVVLDHYPVKSITDIDISPGFFSFGPWDKKLLKISNQEVSLNDIEHRILRPIWKDERIHFAVNCASLGCPNLSREVFTAENTDKLLDGARKEYLNHPRGISEIKKGKVTLSSIFDWYSVDFGKSEKEVLKYLSRFIDGKKAEALQAADISYDYDWKLNE